MYIFLLNRIQNNKQKIYIPPNIQIMLEDAYIFIVIFFTFFMPENYILGFVGANLYVYDGDTFMMIKTVTILAK